MELVASGGARARWRLGILAARVAGGGGSRAVKAGRRARVGEPRVGGGAVAADSERSDGMGDGGRRKVAVWGRWFARVCRPAGWVFSVCLVRFVRVGWVGVFYNLLEGL
jgi:hypothetical protein